MLPNSAVQLVGFGVGQDSLVGNHVTLSAYGAGTPLYLDPTTSIVANGTLYDLLSRRQLTAIRLSERNDAENSSGGFGSLLSNMITKGQLDYRTVLYAFSATPSTYAVPGASFIQKLIAAGRGGRPEYWFITSDTSSLWLLSSSGLAPANYGDTADIVAVDNPVQQGVYMLTATSGDLWYLNDQQWTKLTTGIRSISTGPNGQSVYYIDSNSAAWLIDQAGTRAVNYGNTKSIVGSGDSTYMLTYSGGQLYSTTSGTWTLIANSYSALAASRPPAYRPICDGKNCTFSLEMSGQVLSVAGGSMQMRDINATWSPLFSNVTDFKVGLRGATVNALIGGALWKYNVPIPGIAAKRFYPVAGTDPKSNPYQPGAATWAPALTTSLKSLGWSAGSGNFYLNGTDTFGVAHSIYSTMF